MKYQGISEEPQQQQQPQQYKTISKRLPRWMCKKVKRKEGFDWDWSLFNYIQITDHFEKRRIKSRIAHKGYTESRPDTQEVIYISQPYGPIHMHTLKDMIKVCEENNITFDIRGDSDHYPGRTIMIEWSKKGTHKNN